MLSADDGIRVAAIKELFAASVGESLSDVAMDVFEIAKQMSAIPLTMKLDVNSQTNKLSGPSMDALTVVWLVMPYLADTLAMSPDFWRMVHVGVGASATPSHARKTAVGLLQRGLDIIKRNETEAATATAAAIAQWECLLVFLDALEDFPPHLMEDLWESRLGQLIPASASPHLAASSASTGGNIGITAREGCSSPIKAGRIPIPNFAHPIPFEWTSLILDRAFSHDNPVVKRQLLLKFMALPTAFPATHGSNNSANNGALQGSAMACLQPIVGPTGEVTTGSSHSSLLPTADGSAGISDTALRIGSYSSSSTISDAAIASTSVVAAGSRLKGGAKRENVSSPTADDAACDADVAATATIGLSVPPWYVADPAGTHFLSHIADISLFMGNAEVFGRSLHDYLLAYAGRLAHADASSSAHHSGLAAWARSLISGLHELILNKGAMKWIMKALAGLRPAVAGEGSAETAESPLHLLDGECLAHLRSHLVTATLLNTRSFTESLYRSTLDVLVSCCDPVAIALPQLALMLASFPASMILCHHPLSGSSNTASAPAASNAHATKVTSWLSAACKAARWNMDTRSSGSAGLSALASALKDSIKQYLTPSTTTPSPSIDGAEPATVLFSAASIARIFVLLPDVNGPAVHDSASAATYSSSSTESQASMETLNSAASNVLAELYDALTCVHSHTYMQATRKARALLLSQALIAAGWPGGSLGDVHLARTVTGDAVPVNFADHAHPLHVEWMAACKSAAAAYPTIALFQHGDVPAAPHDQPGTSFNEADDDVGAAVAGVYAASASQNRNRAPAVIQSVLSAFFLQPSVSNELASSLETSCSEGMHRSNTGKRGGLIESSSYSSSQPSNGAPRWTGPAPPVLASTFLLSLLGDLARVSMRQNHYSEACARLLRTALDRLHAVSTVKAGTPDQQAALTVQLTASLHVLSSMLGCISSCPSVSAAFHHDGGHGSASASRSGITAQPPLADAVRLLLGLRFVKPSGATEPAIGGSGDSDSSFDTHAATNTSARNPIAAGDVTWIRLRSFFETCRWISLHGLVRLAGGASAPSTAAAVATHSPAAVSMLARLPVIVAEDLASAALDGMDTCGDDDVTPLLALVSRILQSCLSSDASETPSHVLAAGSASPSLPLVAAQPVTSVHVEQFLPGLERLALKAKPSRRLILSYATSVIQVSTFLRPSLHLPGSDGRAGSVLRLLHFIVDQFCIETRPSHCIQLVAARLIAVWRVLVSIADRNRDTNTTDSTIDVASCASSVLTSHIPLMMKLLLHREHSPIWDDPLLADATARAQLMAWMRANESQAASDGGDDDLSAALRQESSAGAASPAAGEAEAASSSIDRSLVRRGAGALTRVQMLCWLDELSSNTFGDGTGVSDVLKPRSPASRSVIKSILVRLARLNATPEWNRDGIAPGSPLHALKLRSWQAITLLARNWGGCLPADEGTDSAMAFADEATRLISPAASEAAGCTGGVPAKGKSKGAVLPKRNTAIGGKKPATPATSASNASALSAAEDLALDCIPASDSAVALAIIFCAFKHQLQLPQMPSTRQYMESSAVSLARRFPALVTSAFLLPALKQVDMKAQLAFSTTLVATDLTMHLAQLKPTPEAPSTSTPASAELASRLVQSLFPWMTSPTGLVRVLVHTALSTAVPLLFGDEFASGNIGASSLPAMQPASTASAAESPPPGLREWVWPTMRMLRSNPEISEMAVKQRKHFLRVDPASACTLRAILSSPVTEHGELVPIDAYSCINRAFQHANVAMHTGDPSNIVDCDYLDTACDTASKAGLIPMPAALYDERFRQGFGRDSEALGQEGLGSSAAGATGVARSTPAAVAPAPGFNFQRKVLSATEATGGAGSSAATAVGTSEGHAASPSLLLPMPMPPLLEMLNLKGSGGDAAPHAATLALRRRFNPVLTHTGPDGRPYQPIIVLASLVDKVPNLAGLARTCEIFSAQSLVVRDVHVAGDHEFKNISVSAAEWMPIHECKHTTAAMLDYIAARKQQGYTVVGLEQAARSLRLGSESCILPEKMVLVLGAEKEGVPVDIINECDVVIEIPQVSGSVSDGTTSGCPNGQSALSIIVIQVPFSYLQRRHLTASPTRSVSSTCICRPAAGSAPITQRSRVRRDDHLGVHEATHDEGRRSQVESALV